LSLIFVVALTAKWKNVPHNIHLVFEFHVPDETIGNDVMTSEIFIGPARHAKVGFTFHDERISHALTSTGLEAEPDCERI
jgi:hypothetical protein